MGKITIDAQQATADIRSGMKDHTLMAKYRLNAKGLQSLQEKLIQAGLLKPHEIENRQPHGESKVEKAALKVTATQILSEIKSGMRDNELIQKYRISAREVQTLYDRLIAAGLITATEIYKSTSHLESTVDIDADAVMDELPDPLPDWGEHLEIPPVPDSDIVDSDDSPPPMATQVLDSYGSSPPPVQPVVVPIEKKPDGPKKDETFKSPSIATPSKRAPEPKPPLADLKSALKPPVADFEPKPKAPAAELVPEPKAEAVNSAPKLTAPAADIRPEPKAQAADFKPKEQTKQVEQQQTYVKPYTKTKSRLYLVIAGLRWFGLVQLVVGIILTIINVVSPTVSPAGSLIGQLKIVTLPMLISCGIFLAFWAVAEELELRRTLSEALNHNNEVLKRLLENPNVGPHKSNLK